MNVTASNQVTSYTAPQPTSTSQAHLNPTETADTQKNDQTEVDVRTEKLLDRLGDRAGKKMLATEQMESLLKSDSFANLASSLTDKELGELVTTLSALDQATTGLDSRYGNVLGNFSAQSFTDSLASMDSNLREQVLTKANELAQGVGATDADPTYDAIGRHLAGDTSLPGEALRNFAFNITRSEDPSLLLEKLEPFSESQQQDLLKIMVASPEQGLKLADKLTEHTDESRDALLGSLAKISDTRTLEKTPPIPFLSDEYVETDYGNNFSDVVDGMINQVTELLETYEFSSDQIETMGLELGELNRTHQRAYLDITEAGLHELVQKGSSSTDVRANEGEMNIISNLRNSKEVRELVTMSGFGEQNESDNQEFKRIGSAAGDQVNAIKLLVTDAYLTARTEGEHAQQNKSSQLAAKLNISAENRKELITDSTSQGQLGKNISEKSNNDLIEQLSDFTDRIESFMNSSDVEQIATVVNEINDTSYGSISKQKDQLFRATAFAGAGGDGLVQALQGQSDKVRVTSLNYLDTLVDDALTPKEPGALKEPAELAGERMAMFSQVLSSDLPDDILLAAMDKITKQGSEEQQESLISLNLLAA